MPNILVVTGSVRPNSVNEKIVPLVASEVEAQGVTAVVADLKVLNMPFFDGPVPPASPDFVAPHESVRQWTQLVANADAVVFVTPEYNHTMTPVQLNAIDWIGGEWAGKPVGLVGYGWNSGAGQAHATAREVLAVNLKAKVGDNQTNLYFARDLNVDGTVADQERVQAQIAATVAELVVNIEVAQGDATAPATELVAA